MNWDARDGQLALAVRATAAEQARLTGKARCTIAWLCSAIPDLRPKLGWNMGVMIEDLLALEQRLEG